MRTVIENSGGNDSFASGIRNAPYQYHDTKTLTMSRKIDSGGVCTLVDKIAKKGKCKWITGPRESCLYLAGGVAVLRQITRELPRSFPMTQTLHASLSALSDTTHNEDKQAGLTAVRQVQITFMRIRILPFMLGFLQIYTLKVKRISRVGSKESDVTAEKSLNKQRYERNMTKFK